MHRPTRISISRLTQYNKDSNEFSLSNTNKEQLALFQLRSWLTDSSVQAKALKSTARERSKWKEVRRIFKILREIWLNIRVKKVDIHEGIAVKVLLDSSTTGMFMDRKIAIKYRFKLQKLERPVVIRNINRTNNSNPSSKSKCTLQKLYRKNKDRYV